MNARITRELSRYFPDILFVALLIFCLILAVGGIRSSLDKRESLLAGSGGRKVDVDKVRKQITAGTLSPRKARFYKKIAE